LLTAKERWESVRKGPDQLAIDTAKTALDQARADLENTEARLQQLQAGTPQDQLRDAVSGVTSARAGLDAAMARLAELNGRPTRTELQDAAERVAEAQVALEGAQGESEPVEEDLESGAFDLLLLEKGIEQDRSVVETLEAELAATRLQAPFSGIVAEVQARPGDPIEPGRPVLTLAKPGDPIIRVELLDQDGARLAVGQNATVSLDVGDGVEFEASVDDLADTEDGLRVARLRVSWGTTAPAFGTPAHGVVTLQQKADALLVPQRAIRSAGTRRYVEYLDGTSRRTIDVQVGIVGVADVEILSGLAAGQFVLVGQ
jgi:HlyD family secretion protein